MNLLINYKGLKHPNGMDQSIEKSNDKETLRMLCDFLGKNNERNVDFNRLLYHVCEFGKLNTLKFMLKLCNIDPGANENYAIRVASNYGQLEVVKLLLQCVEVNPSAYYHDAIMLAICGGHFEIVKILLTKVDDSFDMQFAITISSQSNKLNILNLLVRNSKKYKNICYDNAIALAASSGHAEIVRYLLSDPKRYHDLEFAINWTNKNGYSKIVEELHRASLNLSPKNLEKRSKEPNGK